MAMEKSHIWVGKFPSKDAFLSYMEESYHDDDNQPINKFASDHKISFYDTDWEESFYDESEELVDLVSHGSYSKDYKDDLLKALKSNNITSANTIIIIDKNEIPNPLSIKGENYYLKYLGEYTCDTTVPDL